MGLNLRGIWGPVWLSWSVAAGVGFALADGLRGARSSQWAGVAAADILEYIAGLAGHVALAVGVGALCVLCALCAGLAAKLGGRRRAARAEEHPVLARCRAAGAGACVAVLVWAALRVPGGGEAPLALLAAGLLVAGARGVAPGAAAGACVAGGLIFGFVGLLAASGWFLFDAARAWWVVVLVGGYAGLGVAGLALALWRGRWAGGAVALLLLLAGLVAVWTPPGGRAGDALEETPNLVLIIADTLRADALAPWGMRPAPTLETLAQRGVVFERHYAAAPWTLPSLVGLFLSEYPASLTPGADQGVWEEQLWRYARDSGRDTLAERLRAAGYATAAITGNPLIPGIPDFYDGFETRAESHPVLLVPGGIFRHFPTLWSALTRVAPALAPLMPNDTSEHLCRYAERWIGRQRAQPFYMWLHLMDPHAPYSPPGGAGMGPWPFFYPYTGGERWGIPVIGPGFAIPEDARDYLRDLYAGESRYVETILARVMGALRARGLEENTIICFTSDHGEEFWEHGRWGHGQALFDESVRVPLLIAGPGIAPRRVTEATTALDVLPALAARLGIAPDPVWRGDATGIPLRGEAMAARPVFVQATNNMGLPEPLQAVVLEGFKLIRGIGSGSVWLHDLSMDPGEQLNMADLYPERVVAMEALLDGWQASFESVFPLARPEGGAEAGFEALRGLGYL